MTSLKVIYALESVNFGVILENMGYNMENISGDFYIIAEKNTILVTLAIRNRLKTYVLKDSTYNNILQHLMDVVDYYEFIENQYRLLEDKDKFASLDDI